MFSLFHCLYVQKQVYGTKRGLFLPREVFVPKTLKYLTMPLPCEAAWGCAPVDVAGVEDDDVSADVLALALLVDQVHAVHVRRGLLATHLRLQQLGKQNY